MKFSYENSLNVITKSRLEEMQERVLSAHQMMHDKTGLGNEYLGWIDWPVDYDKEEFERMKNAAKRIRANSEVLVVVGIGGSYLGARAAIEFLSSPMYNHVKKPQIFFAGNSMSASALNEILEIIRDKEVSLNIISKSGTTLEPALAFRVLRRFMEAKYGEDERKKRIYITTDSVRGALKKLADYEGYECFTVPDNIGGRYSVLTSVGMLPIAVAGYDVDKIMHGAVAAREDFGNSDINANIAYQYAVARNILYNNGKKIEILVNYEPRLQQLAEWWKQLFGESEGKDCKGIYPASVTFSTDLHSLGQYIQDGERHLFETVINVTEMPKDIVIEPESKAEDGLKFLEGKTYGFVNKQALLGTMMAHNNGGVPNLVIDIEKSDEYNLGYLTYFFMKACGMSGYLLGVNPFDQPGVEEYKKNMYALLRK